MGKFERRIEIVLVTEQSMLNTEQVCSINNEPHSCMDPIIMYLLHEELPKNKNEAKNLRIRTARYIP